MLAKSIIKEILKIEEEIQKKSLNRTKHIILSKKKEFSDDSATEEEENTKYHEQKIVF